MIKTLIVEDEKWVRKGLINIINWSEHGMKLIGEAENGEEALNICETEKPDLIITDMKMPKSSGIEFLRRITEIKIDCEIIIISGYSDFEYMRQAISSNVFEYVLKPVDEKDLNEILKNVKGKFEKKRIIASRLDVGKQYFEGSVLADLIIGNIEKYETTLYNAQVFGINLNYKVFSIISILINTMDNNKDNVFINLLEHICNEIFYTHTNNLSFNFMHDFHLGNTITILCKSNRTDFKKLEFEQESVCKELISTVKNRFNIGIRAGIGGWVEGVTNICISNKEANISIKYQRQGYPEIIFYKNLKETMKSEKELELHIDEKRICYIIQNSDVADALNMLNEIVVVLKCKEYVRISSLHKCIIKLLMAFESSIQKYGSDNGIDSDPNSNYIEIIEKINTIEELHETMKKALSLIVTNSVIKKIKGGEEIVNSIKKYIENNYNEDVSLIYMAQKYYVNHIYLSRIFKNQTGENFIDFLTRIRMSRAKELIERGQLKIKDVSELVGYSNPYYFTKSYKKYFGYLPTETYKVDLFNS